MLIVSKFPGGSDSKESACNAGDPGLIPGSGKSSGKENGYPLQYSCLENSVARGAWRATVWGLKRVGHNWATNPFTFKINCLRKSSDLETAFHPLVTCFIAVNLLSQLWLSFFLTWLQRKVEKGQSMKLHWNGMERIKTQQKFSLCW